MAGQPGPQQEMRRQQAGVIANDAVSNRSAGAAYGLGKIRQAQDFDSPMGLESTTVAMLTPY